jgi:DUF917 family protein
VNVVGINVGVQLVDVVFQGGLCDVQNVGQEGFRVGNLDLSGVNVIGQRLNLRVVFLFSFVEFNSGIFALVTQVRN